MPARKFIDIELAFGITPEVSLRFFSHSKNTPITWLNNYFNLRVIFLNNKPCTDPHLDLDYEWV